MARNNNNAKGRRKYDRKEECDKREDKSYGEKPERGGMRRTRRGNNDPAWYASDAAILRDAASLPFSWAQGTSVNLGFTQPSTVDKNLDKYYVPGIQVLYLDPSVGYADSASDPINVASTSVYSFIRHANSGHANYDSVDLMCYLISMTQAYSYIVYLERLYFTATMYSQRNRYLPRVMTLAQGGNFDDITAHLADFRYGINALINKISSMAVPDTFTIFKRAAFLYQYIYCEGTSVKDQMYIYMPASFGKLGLPNKTNQPATCVYLEPFAIDKTKIPAEVAPARTVDQLITFGNNLIADMISDEDMNIMSGDILKAYGQNILKLAPIPEMVDFAPVFNIGVLEQMKNATVLMSQYSDTLEVTPNNTVRELMLVQNTDKSILLSHPVVKQAGNSSSLNYQSLSSWYAFNSRRLMTTTTDAVTPELVIESSRLMTAPRSAMDSSKNFPIACGSERAIAVAYWGYKWNSSGSSYGGDLAISTTLYDELSECNSYTIGTGTQSWVQDAYNRLTDSSCFRFHPIFYSFSHFKYTTGSGGATINTASGIKLCIDLDNFTTIDSDVLQRMHEAALLNMLHVPAIAKVTM